MADPIDRVLSACLQAMREKGGLMRVDDIQRATQGRFFAREVIAAMEKAEASGLVTRVPALIGGDSFVLREGSAP